MIAATDPSNMTPEERRAEVVAILAVGFLRLSRRPRPLPSRLQNEAKDLPHSPPGIHAGFSRN
ncbi:MAG: hypothetical protein IMZ62_04960 [Chloroflexi bacterium]|nr:hypothetical protein [Chloroflexota bacterium]